jgi:hypothetical protein
MSDHERNNDRPSEPEPLRPSGQEPTESSVGIFGQISKWLKWYYILPAVLVFCYLSMLVESISQSRKERRQTEMGQTEGMAELSSESDNAKKIKSAIRREDRREEAKKRVSFQKLSWKEYLPSAVFKMFNSIYEWWIMPWIYVLARSNGLG